MDFAFEKIVSIPSLKLEYGIVLVKQNKIEEGVYKIFFSDFPAKMRVIKRLISVLPIFEVVYLFLKYIITNYNKSPERLNTLLNNTEDLPVEDIVIDILEVVKKEYYLIYVRKSYLNFNLISSSY